MTTTPVNSVFTVYVSLFCEEKQERQCNDMYVASISSSDIASACFINVAIHHGNTAVRDTSIMMSIY